MTMKKIIALGLSAMMMLTATIASAELVVDTADKSITTLPTEADIKARNPKVDFVVGEKFTTDDAVKTATSRGFSNSNKVADKDIYPLTVTLSSIGDLAAGYGIEDEDYVYASMFDITLLLDTTAIKDGFTKTEWGGAKFSAAQHSTLTNYYALGWSNTSYYPSNPTDDLQVIEDAPIVMEYVVAVDKDATVTVTDFVGEITYKVGLGSKAPIKCTNVTFPAELKIGAKAPDPEPTAPVVTGTDAGVVVTDGVNGKVWNDVKVENTTLGTNYRAKFTETTTGKTSIHNFQNFGEVGGTAEFAVILNTLKDVANITLEIIYDAVQ